MKCPQNLGTNYSIRFPHVVRMNFLTSKLGTTRVSVALFSSGRPVVPQVAQAKLAYVIRSQVNLHTLRNRNLHVI